VLNFVLVVLNRSVWLLLFHISDQFFFRGGVVSSTPNPQPGGPGLRIYVPWRQGGPAIPPGTGFPFQSPLTTCRGLVGLFFSALTQRTNNIRTLNKLQDVRHLTLP
jgi:hypothetical protein